MDRADLRDLAERIRATWGVFDLAAREARLADLEALTSEPGFWDDQRTAQRVLREADGLRTEIELWRDLEARALSLEELFDMATEAGDDDMLHEIDRDVAAIRVTYELERTALLFNGEYDGGSALISISAGAGGTEATDWAEMPCGCTSAGPSAIASRPRSWTRRRGSRPGSRA